MIHRYRFGWLFTMDDAPMQDAIVAVEGGQVVAIDEAGEWPDVIDLRDWAVMPALVNAHTHLEFSSLSHPLGTEGMPFSQWIPEVIRYRQGVGENLAQEKALAIRRGLKQSAGFGVGVVGEIATLPLAEASYDRSDVHVVSMLEVLGLDPDTFDQRKQQASEHVEYRWSKSNVTSALSPHAPYSTSCELIDHCAALSQKHQLPLAMHLAESKEELELLEMGTGPFRTMLENMGLYRAEDFPGGRKPADYIERLAGAYRALVVHGNYLSEKGIEILHQHADTMTVCYCPRTHAFFHHPPHPIEDLLADGIRVVLGTDSRSSNPDLNLWAEVQLVHRKFPDIAAEQLLSMVTMDAAFALGVEQSFGSIEEGKSAVVSAFCIGKDSPDPLGQMLARQPRLWNLSRGSDEFDLTAS